MKIGAKHNLETRKKMSLAKKGKVSNWKGKHPTEESRLKMRLSHLGKEQSEETKEKRRVQMLGNTQGFKKGHSVTKGIKKSKEHVAKFSGEKHYAWKGGDAEYKRKHAPRPKPEQCETCGAFGVICYDHDHKTGKFRGWICKRCNFALGLVKDNTETLQSLIEYLKSN